MFGKLCLGKKECENICLETSIEVKNSNLHVDLTLSSTTDTVLYLDERMLVVGCPFYTENRSHFEREPQAGDLLFDQVLLENKEGQFRVFSSSFVYDNGEEIITMANCAFMDEKELVLDFGNKEKVSLGVLSINDLKVKERDKEIRVHLYLKGSDGNGTILTSNNWIQIEEYEGL